jgi:Cysteine-rich CPXCG
MNYSSTGYRNPHMLRHIDCPYCGESFETAVDTSCGSQQYIEDCPVCCRPIEFQLEVGVSGELASLTTRRDDD